ncbi:unnamed protein product [Allacma fusca]|uniref:Carboxylesterase type B domain-containing protein n=1 Tax=Allacma fusca TaxID=39272 RepID=A0A8J2P7J2_9HEXA|nr:unnamed protein product [Allacma fusca]
MFSCSFVVVSIVLTLKFVATTSPKLDPKFTAGEDEDFPQENYQLNSIVPLVKCPAGTFRGSLEYTRGGRRYFSFQSIPYAEAPGRFETATPKAPIKGIYDATTQPPICPQIPEGETEYSGQEDCLYLSVSKPEESHCREELSNGKLLPVMFWIHPGSFLNRNGSFYKGTYLLDECVVLVTFEYRLGALEILTNQKASQWASKLSQSSHIPYNLR